MSAVFPNRPVIRHIRVACPPGQPPSAGTVSSSRTRPSESHMPQAIGAAVKGADASAKANNTRALPLSPTWPSMVAHLVGYNSPSASKPSRRAAACVPVQTAGSDLGFTTGSGRLRLNLPARRPDAVPLKHLVTVLLRTVWVTVREAGRPLADCNDKVGADCFLLEPWE